MSADLVCPRCARPHPADERFCLVCGMPLVHADADGADPELTAAQERARKVRKQYLEGPLTKVAAARHQAEAELIQGLLLEEGVPSMVRRTGGFDVPDMLFSGPREILVPASGVDAAREILQSTDQDFTPSVRTASSPTRVFAIVAVMTLVVAGVSPLLLWLFG